MGIRRTHTKSRKGCVQCKQKHTKCDEKRPTCTNCIKFERKCSFQSEPIPPQASREPSSDASPIPSSSQSRDSSVLSPTEELGLMHHWTAFTCKTLARGPHNLHIWQEAMPQIGLSHRFLLDGIFAITCVHLCSEETDPTKRRRYLRTALEYQNRAVGPFKYALENIQPDNCHAAYASAIATMTLRFALPGAYEGMPQDEIPDPKENIVETTRLLTGVGVVSDVCKEYLDAGPLGSLFVKPSDNEVPAADIYGEEEQALRKVYGFIASSDDIDTMTKEMYYDKLESLRKCFYQYKVYEVTSSVMNWTTLAADMMPYFQAGDTMALLIVMHWGVLVHQINDRWWARNSGRRLITALASSLEGRLMRSEWVESVEWAHRKVDLPTEHFSFRPLEGSPSASREGVFHLH